MLRKPYGNCPIHGEGCVLADEHAQANADAARVRERRRWEREAEREVLRFQREREGRLRMDGGWPD